MRHAETETEQRMQSGQVRLAVVMDPISAIKPVKDTTLAMLLAAQRRGWRTQYLELGDLWLRDGEACGRARPLTVRDDGRDWYTLGPPADTRLGDFDVILMRKDPPFDTEYIYATYILERAEGAGALVVNRPQGLRDMNEKVYTAWFPECCAPTLITRDMPAMHEFLREHGRIVCKPLHSMGGRSIFVIETGDKNAGVIFETLTVYGSQYAIVQRYLPEIAQTGDSRVILVDGEPVPFALARIPSATDHRGNLAAGARGVGRPLEERDHWLASRIGPKLRERGMLFVGLDVIGGFVTEINVTSPTGVREIDRQFGTDIAGLLMDAIAKRLAAAA
jgi:glutathione synthase